MPLARILASRALAACGTLLIVTAAVAWTTGGLAFAIGPLSVSATDPARLIMEGSVSLLAWAILGLEEGTTRTAAIVTGILLTYYLALVGESSPRKYGDGHEYIAMARQLSGFAPPGLAPGDIDVITAEMSALPGYGAVALRAPALVGTDGRQDFMHFWLFPLAVAPMLSVVRAAGAHWNYAFTIVNLALLAAFAWCAVVRLRLAVAVLLACGPIIWWIDKAHVEVFNYSLIGIALLLLTTAPRASLLLLGAVTAQNPAFAALLAPVAVALVWSAGGGERRRRLAAASLGAVLIAAVHPAYYLWHLGIATPLSGAAGQFWPGLTAILTPLVDPDLGLVWWFPGLVGVLAIVMSTRDARPNDLPLLLAVSVGALTLLLFVATSGNINHGCTPGLSRYGVWLIPCAVTLLGRARALTGWREIAAAGIALGSVGQTSWTSHPKLPENSTAPTSASIWISDHVPRLYDPLPEVFAERYSGRDGVLPLPVASRDCAKVLMPGTGRPDAPWPIPCRPAPIPDACRTPGILCYANRVGDGYEFDRAPRQPSFAFIAHGEPDLLWAGPSDFEWLPMKIAWLRMTSVLPLGHLSPIRAAEHVGRLVAFRNTRDFVAFVATLSPCLDQPRLRLSPLGEGAEWWWVDLDRKIASPQGALRPDGWVDVPCRGTRLLVVRRKTETR